LEVFEKKLLGFDNFPDKIRKAFDFAVDHDSKKGVQQFAYLTTTDDKLHEKMVGMEYTDLCKHLNDKQYMPCVRSVYERLWEVMCSHHKMLKYHEAYEQGEIDAGRDPNMFYADVCKTLKDLKKVVWDLIKKRVEGLLFTPFLMRCKVERLLYIFSLTKLLIEHSEQYDRDGGSSANAKLHKSIKEESLKYFESFDRGNVQIMLDVLDNESWFALPMGASFSSAHIPELRVPKTNKLRRIASALDSPGSPTAQKDADRWAECNPFEDKEEEQRVDAAASGIAIAPAEEEEEAEEDLDPRLLQDYIDEDHPDGVARKRAGSRRGRGGSVSGRGGPVPVLTNCSMTLMRLIGKYAHMVEVLDSVEGSVLEGLSLLYDIYCYSVFSTFSNEDLPLDMSPGLENMVRGMKERLKTSPVFGPRLLKKEPNVLKDAAASPAAPEKKKNAWSMTTTFASMEKSMSAAMGGDKKKEAAKESQYPSPLTPLCDLSNPGDLYGLQYRFAAVKSLTMVHSVLGEVRSRFEKVAGLKDGLTFGSIAKFYEKVTASPPLLSLPSPRGIAWCRSPTLRNWRWSSSGTSRSQS